MDAYGLLNVRDYIKILKLEYEVKAITMRLLKLENGLRKIEEEEVNELNR